MQKTDSLVTPITASTFDRDVQQETRTVLIDATTPWCPPCRMMAPLVEQIATEHAQRVKVYSVDVSEDQELGRKLHITAVPTFLIYRDGQLVERFQGAVSKRVLLAKLGLA